MALIFVLGNPPYIFARNKKFTSKLKKYYYAFYEIQKYQLNTYGLFTERTYNLLTNNGFFGFIIPNNWLTIDSFSEFRKFILNNSSKLKIINIYDKIFDTASVDSCILIFSKDIPNKLVLAEMTNNTMDVVGEFNFDEFENNDNIINISLLKEKGVIEILKKIEVVSSDLVTLHKVSTGLKAYEVGKGTPPQTEDIKKYRKFHSKEKLGKDYLPYLQGRDVKRYKISWSGEYLKYGNHLSAPRKSVPFTGTRILVRQIPSKLPYCINATLVSGEILHDLNSMVIFNGNINDSKFVISILNSKLISFWFFYKLGKLQRKTFPQFKVKELKTFPIFNNPSKQEKNNLISLVDEITQENNDLDTTIESFNNFLEVELGIKINKTINGFYNLKFDDFFMKINKKNVDDNKYNLLKKNFTKSVEIINQLNEKINITNEKINNLVYKLYSLTEEEINFIENVNK